MKPNYKHQTNGYGGCLWMIVIVVLVAMWMASCATTKKDGCGTEHYNHKFKS